MGTLLGSALLTNAKARKRVIEGKLAAIGRSVTRAAKDTSQMSKNLAQWKRSELNDIKLAQQNALQQARADIASRLSASARAVFEGTGDNFGVSSLSEEDKLALQRANSAYSDMQAQIAMEASYANNNIENKYENLSVMSEEPLKDEEADLQDEKTALEQELKMIEEEIKFAEEMFKNGVKDMFPNYSS